MESRRWAVLILIVVLGSAVGIVGADVHATADRDIETTTVDPGQTVEVTMNVTVTNETTVDYVEEFEPAYEAVELVTVRNNGDDISPFFEDVTGESLLVATDDVTPGTVEIVYTVTIPSSAETGAEYQFNGEVQVNEEPVSITGPTTITVGDQEDGTDSSDDGSTGDGSTGGDDSSGSDDGDGSSGDGSSGSDGDGDDDSSDGDDSTGNDGSSSGGDDDSSSGDDTNGDDSGENDSSSSTDGSDDSDDTEAGENTDTSDGSETPSADDDNTGDSVPGFGVLALIVALSAFMLISRTE